MKAKTTPRESTPLDIQAETRHFFYSCPGLDLWSVGRTREEAERRLREDVQILLARCSKYDDLDKLLEDRCLKTYEIRYS
ncbi:MAG: hypothetical protein WAU81_09505 [Candidatus Aminicenantales bacterium]